MTPTARTTLRLPLPHINLLLGPPFRAEFLECVQEDLSVLDRVYVACGPSTANTFCFLLMAEFGVQFRIETTTCILHITPAFVFCRNTRATIGADPRTVLAQMKPPRKGKLGNLIKPRVAFDALHDGKL